MMVDSNIDQKWKIVVHHGASRLASKHNSWYTESNSSFMEPSINFDENHDQIITSWITSNIGFKNKFHNILGLDRDKFEDDHALDTVEETS